MHALIFLQEPAAVTVAVPKEVEEWEKKRGEYVKHFGSLVASIKSSSIEPITLDCNLSSKELAQSAVTHMEG